MSINGKELNLEGRQGEETKPEMDNVWDGANNGKELIMETTVTRSK